MTTHLLTAVALVAGTSAAAPAARTGSIPMGCTEEQMDGLGPWIAAVDAQTGDLVHEWNNTYWLGHVDDDTGNVLPCHRG